MTHNISKQPAEFSTSGQMEVVGASYDSLEDATKVSVINGRQTDYDQSPQIMADETDSGTINRPSNNGAEVGQRQFLNITAQIRDGALTIEASDDQIIWTDITKDVYDKGAASAGATSFADAADMAIVQFLLELKMGHRYVRYKWTPNDATSNFKLFVTARAI